MADKAIAPHGYQVSTKKIFHGDGSSTECETLQCTKETKYDKDGNVVRQDNMDKGTFASAKRDFFSGSSSK